MRLLVVRTHLRGSLLPRRELQAMPGVLGELLMIETVDQTFRGEIKVAKLHDLKGGKQLDDVMPPL